MTPFLNKDVAEDVSLKKFNLDNLPLLKSLKTTYLNTKVAVCIERAKLITEYLKKSDDNEPIIIKRARAINHYLSNREIIFHDENLIGGATSSKALGAPVYPEYLGLSIWPEIETISERTKNPQLLTEEEADILNFEIYPYWMDKSILEITRKEVNPKALPLMEKMVFYLCSKASVISHTTPFFEKVLEIGLDGMIAEAVTYEKAIKVLPISKENDEKITFYQAMQISMLGIKNYSYRISEKALLLAKEEKSAEKKKYYEELAKICFNVPAKGAKTLREAVNSLWLCQVGIHAENVNMAINPGRLDQILYPYYKRDVEENNLSTEDTLNILGSLWFKISDNTNLVPEAAERLFGGAGSVPAVTLGGIDKNGNDAVNDLTYILLKITECLCTKDPNVNARYHYEVNNATYRDRVVEVIANTRAIPALYNDVSNIETLINQGLSTEHARDYAVIGCVEISSAGREYSASSSIFINLSAALEMAMHNGKRPYFTDDAQIGPITGIAENFKSFDEFWQAFKTQLQWLMQQAIDLNEALGSMYQKYLPTPLFSCFIEGCLEKGKDLIYGGALYNSSGTTNIAFADTCDSLNAIEDVVFVNKKASMKQLMDAVNANFEAPHDKLLNYIKEMSPKYGKEHRDEIKDGIAEKNAKEVVKFIYEFFNNKKNYRGGNYRPAYWTMTNHAGHGKIAGALPSGRKAKVVFSSGITPSSQEAPELIPALSSVAKLSLDENGKSKYIPGAYALNIKYTPEPSQSKTNFINEFGSTLDAYFRTGGMQIQFNVQSYETLIDAKNNPEKYPELLVRVSGYSAYFKDLNDAMKDELILRTQYDLHTGQAVILKTN